MPRQSFPAWFDPAAFRLAFDLDVRGLPIFEVHYEVTATENSDGVDVAQEYVDDRGDYRIAVLRRIRDIGVTKIAEHIGFYVIDDPPHPNQRFQQKGLATAHLRKVIPFYDCLGVTFIQLAAARKGRTVWPKFGFSIDSSERIQFENVLIGLEYKFTGSRPARERLPRTGPDILNYMVKGHPVGKLALEARAIWTMQLDLTNSAQRGILEAKCRL